MRLFATIDPDGNPWTVGSSPNGAIGKTETLEDRCWEELVERGWTVVPVSLTELPADSDERRG